MFTIGTPLTLGIVTDGRVWIGTVRGDGSGEYALVNLADGQPFSAIRGDQPCETRDNIMNRVQHKGAGLFTSGSFSLTALGDWHGKSGVPFRYSTFREFVERAFHGRGLSQAKRNEIVAGMAKHYGWDD